MNEGRFGQYGVLDHCGSDVNRFSKNRACEEQGCWEQGIGLPGHIGMTIGSSRALRFISFGANP